MSSATPEGINVDYYAVLGLRRSATGIQIRAKFRQLALLKHPDKDLENPNATVEFQLIETAYSTLIDPDRRRVYDELYNLAAHRAATQERFSGWEAWSWSMERQPRPYGGPEGSNPVNKPAPDHPSRPPPVPASPKTANINEKPPTSSQTPKPFEEPVSSPRPKTRTPASYHAERIALECKIAELHAERLKLTAEGHAARADLAVLNDVLERMAERTSTVSASSSRASLGAVFSARKKAEEEARLQERIIARNLERRSKEAERDQIRASLGKLSARLKGVVEDIAQLRKDWQATWTIEQAGKDAVRAWEAREAERENLKQRAELLAREAEKKKAAQSDFESSRANIREGKKKATGPATKTTKGPAPKDSKAWGPPPTKPPSRPLPLTPDEIKAKMSHRERMMQEEIEEMDRCFRMMQKQEAERASARAAQEAAAIYTDESFRPPPAAAGPPPAYRQPSPAIQHVSVAPLTMPDGTICHHKGIWGPSQSRGTCTRCHGPRGVTPAFRCRTCDREVCSSCWGDLC